jgi:hypothetical protein
MAYLWWDAGSGAGGLSYVPATGTAAHLISL